VVREALYWLCSWLGAFYLLCYRFQAVTMIKSGKYLHGQGNIATTKLIQWGNAEKAENKAFRGFGRFDFPHFRCTATIHGLFCLAILHLFLTIAL